MLDFPELLQHAGDHVFKHSLFFGILLEHFNVGIQFLVQLMRVRQFGAQISHLLDLLLVDLSYGFVAL